MHLENAQQFQINMENVARWAGLQPIADPVLRCEKCGKELKDDDLEDSAYCNQCLPEGGDFEEND